jgi:hypothetical protein
MAPTFVQGQTLPEFLKLWLRAKEIEVTIRGTRVEVKILEPYFKEAPAQ